MKINEIFKDKDVTINNYLTYCGVKDINKFLNPKWEIDDYYNYYGIYHAIEMFNKHFVPLNSAYIICDADLDGITSTSILYSYMIDLGFETEYDWDIQILLHKGKERGLQDEDIFSHIVNNPRPFVIIPDAGTNDREQVKYLQEQLNIDVLVLDKEVDLF